jgi:uncharacterized protein (TIGR03382 family)
MRLAEGWVMPAKLALPLALLAACVTTDDAGVIEQEIVGGTSVTTTDFPTVVALQHGAGNWFCTGVLVHKDWVLTSASCFDDTSATQVRIGDGNLNDGTTSGQTITVSNIYKHPQFSTSDTVWRHDVAVLKLATSVTDRTPSAIRRTAAAVGTSFVQAGFGENNNNGGGGGQLRSLSTTNIDCAGAGDSGITNANLLCFNAADGTGSCWGDGGAPAFAAGAVAGVASGGTGNSCTSGLDVYTSLVPVAVVTPPPMDTPPPPPNPDGGGSGSGSGGERDPDDDGKRGPARASCNAGGEAGWLAAFGVALMAMLRRRRR